MGPWVSKFGREQRIGRLAGELATTLYCDPTTDMVSVGKGAES
jgi:hypothetical protein